jgi:hypothetical protein
MKAFASDLDASLRIMRNVITLAAGLVSVSSGTSSQITLCVVFRAGAVSKPTLGFVARFTLAFGLRVFLLRFCMLNGLYNGAAKLTVLLVRTSLVNEVLQTYFRISNERNVSKYILSKY